MKKLLISIMLVVSSFFFSIKVNAWEYFETVEYKVAFEETVDYEAIKTIAVGLEVNPTAQGQEVYMVDEYLVVEENFRKVKTNEILFGEIELAGIRIGNDAGAIKYKFDYNITYPSPKKAVIQIVVYNKDLSTTKSTADKTVIEQVIKDHIMTDEDRELYEEYEKDKTTTTTTANGRYEVVTDPSSGQIIYDPETSQPITTYITTTATTTKSQQEIEREEKEKKEKEEKEAKNKKETLILKIMWGIIGAVVVLGGVFVTVKIYKASKMQ